MSLIDAEMKSQLSAAFQSLEHTLDLVYEPTSHPDQGELLELLHGLAESSPRIVVRQNVQSNQQSPYPRFSLHRAEGPTGITFHGIPGGHEFTSLVVAILNADGKGKLPDSLMRERIRNLKGPIRIQTYISLTCENCPDVVQALNLMSLLHPDFKHDMIDGGYVPETIEKLGIQGVPSLVENQELWHSGRISLLDLMTKLEDRFGKGQSQTTAAPANRDLGFFDVAVIGGGPAGASAAIYSVRKGLKTALIAEKFGGQVQETKGIENLISIPYTEGPQLVAQLNQHVSSYPVQILDNRRVQSIDAEGRVIHLESGEFLKANSVIISTGAKWRELGIPGEREYIGRGVAFCPHCDGPYYKGKKVAVIGGGNSGVEAAIDLAGIVGEVVLLEFSSTLKADQILVNRLKSLPNTSIVTSAQTVKILGDGKKVRGLEYKDLKEGALKEIQFDGVFVQIGLVPNSQFAKGLIETTQYGEIVVDGKGRTSIPWIYAAGDVTTTPFKQIIIAMGEGAKAALASFEDRMYVKATS